MVFSDNQIPVVGDVYRIVYGCHSVLALILASNETCVHFQVMHQAPFSDVSTCSDWLTRMPVRVGKMVKKRGWFGQTKEVFAPENKND